MIIKKRELTNFKSSHGHKAEVAIMTAFCFMYDLEPGSVTRGNFPDYDFTIGSPSNNRTFELKISSKGLHNGTIELGRADGRPSGLSITKAVFHMFLNPCGSGRAKLRIIPTYDLKAYYSIDHHNTFITQTNGDEIGSLLAPFNIMNFKDLMVGECDYDIQTQKFDTSTFKPNDYALKMVKDFIK